MNHRPAHGARAAIALIVGLAAVGGAAAQTLPLSAQDPVGGATVTIAAGNPATHVVLFATWCPPCVDELEDLAALEARWGDLGYRLVIVAVSARQDADRLARFRSAHSPPGRLLFDADGAVQAALGAEELPAHFVFDRSGALVVSGPSLDGAVEDRIEELVRRTGRR